MLGSFWQRLTRGVRRLRQRGDWPAFVGADWPEHIMAASVTDRFHAKQGRSTGRLILRHDGAKLAVYLKRHFRLPWWQGWLAALWPGQGWSPAWQELLNLERARAMGLLVPATVAAGEFIGPWGKLQSVLAVEELPDMLALHEAIPEASRTLDEGVFRAWKRGLVREVARLARTLHCQSWFHKDLYLCHFYVARTRIAAATAGSDWRGHVHVIDLHRLAHHPWLHLVWQVKDLAQLLYSSAIEGVDERERLLFWKEYLGPERKTRRGRWLRTLVTLKWRRYSRHNTKRRLKTAAAA